MGLQFPTCPFNFNFQNPTGLDRHIVGATEDGKDFNANTTSVLTRLIIFNYYIMRMHTKCIHACSYNITWGYAYTYTTPPFFME